MLCIQHKCGTQQSHACCAGYAGADLQALCTSAVMAALQRSSPEILLDPRLEEAIPLTTPCAAAAAACPPRGEDQLSGSLHSPQRASSAAMDSRQAGPPSSKGGDKQHISGASIAATGLAQGTSLVYESLQPSEQQISNEHPKPAEAARIQESMSQAAIEAGHVRHDAADPAQASTSQPAAPADAQDLTAPAEGISALGHAHPDRAPVIDPGGRLSTEAASALEALEVRACDWRKALMSAPEACARRGSMAAMSAAAAQALPAQLGHILLPTCAMALQVCCMPSTLLSLLRCSVIFWP